MQPIQTYSDISRPRVSADAKGMLLNEKQEGHLLTCLVSHR